MKMKSPTAFKSVKLKKSLNIFKDLPQSKENVEQMKQYTNRGLIEGECDGLRKMFVPKRVLKQDGGHRIERTCKNSENTEIPCTEIRPNIQSILHYIESVGGILRPGVIFADVSNTLSSYGNTCHV